MTEQTTTETNNQTVTWRKNPGQWLVEEYLVPAFPHDLRDLARRAHIPHDRLRRLIRGQDRIDETMATKLAKFFRTTPEQWLELQERYDRGEQL